MSFNIRGVSALNRNDLAAAMDQDFRKALMPSIRNNAFAVNNIGYLSEIEGDRETACSSSGARRPNDRIQRDGWSGYAASGRGPEAVTGILRQRCQGSGQGRRRRAMVWCGNSMSRYCCRAAITV